MESDGATLFVFVHVCSSAYYYNKMKSGGSDVDALDGKDEKSETNQQTPSRYIYFPQEDEDEQDRSLLTAKVRLGSMNEKADVDDEEESQVMQMQLRIFNLSGMSGSSSSSSSNKKNNLQQSNIGAAYGGSSNNNGGIGGGLLVWNYETTGQPID